MSRDEDYQKILTAISLIPEMHEDIKALTREVARMHEDQALTAQKVEAACKDRDEDREMVQRLNVDIHGNGKTGLRGEMLLVNHRLDAIEGKLTAYGRAVWGGLSAIAIALLNSFLDLLIY